MKRINNFGLALRTFTGVAIGFSCVPTLAQSDGTLEETYAVQCPKHEDTAVCRVLRDAMTRSVEAPAAARASVSGSTASLPTAPVPLTLPWDLKGTWQNETGYVIQFKWIDPGKFRANMFPPGGQGGTYEEFKIAETSKGAMARRASTGSLFMPVNKYRLTAPDPGRFKLERGKLDSTTFVPAKSGAWNGVYRRLSREAVQQWVNQWKVAKELSSGGDSGLFGALAMATGAALAGGNTEMVYGAAMKGVEMTTDNEGLRSGLAGQGDAMINAGAQRMTAERALGSQGQTTASAGTSAPRPRRDTAGNANMAPLRVYFWVPMVIHAGDTRNTLCYSNVLTLDPIDLNARDNTRAVAMITPYWDRFLNKCRQYRELDGRGTYAYIEPTRDAPPREFDPRDYRVIMP